MYILVAILTVFVIVYLWLNKERISMNLRIREYSRVGVNFTNSSNVYIEKNVRIGKGTTIYPNVHLYADTRIGQDCTIWPGANIFKTQIGDNCTIWPNVSMYDAQIGAHTTIHSNNRIVSSFIYEYSKIDSHCLIKYSEIGSGCKVGPRAYIQEYSTLKDDSEVANIEIVRSTIGEGTKAKHGRYIGDAVIGKNCNIGAGTVFCNYNGKSKLPITIGCDVFIGSGSMLIAPLLIGDESFIAAGSIVGKNILKNTLVIARGQPHKHNQFLDEIQKSEGDIHKVGYVYKNDEGWNLGWKK